MAKTLNPFRPQVAALKAELSELTGVIVTEAQAGDPDARRWLVAAFPGHDRILASLWGGVATPEAGQEQRCRTWHGRGATTTATSE